MKKYLNYSPIVLLLMCLLSFSASAQFGPSGPTIDTSKVLPIACEAESNVGVLLPGACFNAASAAEALFKYEKFIVRRATQIKGMPECRDFIPCPPDEQCYLYFVGWLGNPPPAIFNAGSGKWCFFLGFRRFRLGCSECRPTPPPCPVPAQQLADWSDDTTTFEGPEALGLSTSPFQGLQLSPSPAINQLHLNAQLEVAVEQLRMVLYDLDGRVVMDRVAGYAEAGAVRQTMNISYLKAGYYLLTIYDGEQLLETKKVVISK